MDDLRPNILLITSDQQHWNTVGCLNPEVKTPNLDRLAAEGTMFTRAYTVNPTCTPARASMITGKYPSQHGAWALGTKLPETEHTIGEDFAAAGYRTALVGKAHFQPLKGTDEFTSLEAYPVLQDLEFWRKFHGPFYGFEHVELARNHADEAHVGQHYAIWMEEKGLGNWRDYFRPPTGSNASQKHKWLIPEEYHYDAWIAERTNALLERFRTAGDSFFLWASFFDPHPPYLVPEPWDTMYDPDSLTVPRAAEGEHLANPPHFRLTQERNPDFSRWRESGHWMHGLHSHVHDKGELAEDIAVYYGMISLMDKYVGAILDRLDELGLAENTLVIFTTDHGHFFGQHGLTAKGPFHYEDMIKLPFIARYPGRTPAGARTDVLLSLVDLPRTFLSLAGIPAPRSMAGLDQSEVLLGKQEQVRDYVIVENHHEPTTIHVKTLVGKRDNLTVYCNRDYGELFDLEQDPGETCNLWDQPECRALKQQLTMRLLFAEMDKEPLWMPRVAGA
ncbi:MAG: sulfatase-like hydrolase/transferase [Planctomycetota bacterium]|jgi:uncharacterized sulfatase